ncbi:MAG TPA: DNA replication protein DnaC [Ruminococcus sp.]|nr:DNA replication protein DnaC [Ruminococcus sp.]
MNESIFNEAMKIIQSRRFKAISEQEARSMEIDKKIPEFATINQQLAQTSLKILSAIQSGGNVQEKLETLKQNNLTAQEFSKSLLVENGYPADYLDTHYQCDMCSDTGYYDGHYCDCLRSAIAFVGVARMQRDTQLKLCSFEQFSLKYYEGKTIMDSNGMERDCYKVMKSTLSKCIEYASHFGNTSESMLFVGKAGLGKTHLSLSIAKAVLETGHEVIYDSVINLLAKIEKEHFAKVESDIDTLSLLLDVDLLILDDLGTEFDTPFNVSTVYNIINTRLNHNKPTIISTNLTFPEIKSRYAERITSRLFASYTAVPFYGSDIRLMKKKESI